MFLKNNACDDPRVSQLKPSEFRAFIAGCCYSSEWKKLSLHPAHQRYCGITPRIAAAIAATGLATVEDNGYLTWTCDDLVRFDQFRSGRRVRNGDGHTYLIQAGEGGLVKIGSTFNAPEARLKELQTGSSEPLRLVKVLSGAHLEGRLHARYAPFRTRGEWFDARILDDLA